MTEPYVPSLPRSAHPDGPASTIRDRVCSTCRWRKDVHTKFVEYPDGPEGNAAVVSGYRWVIECHGRLPDTSEKRWPVVLPDEWCSMWEV